MADELKNTVVAAVRDTLLSERLKTILEAATDADVEVRRPSAREVQFRVRPRHQGPTRWFLVIVKEQM